ncbi:tRNA (adenosine(37)-N6)-threonylcarbamoyltransferase complex ATPase subunit type 1 TsaE [Frigidibacter sp. RF13]|uniref:tRNA (adenosine(37)-N6)-threonylcarbamoyltransferase complex ATPase subunit type 1 TsaE n=1 Tax=Frigidibacter sp. RF13 TaxID=2997340 RepID=UPI00226FA9F4|nr:tRNA (adenosine(37)-N6)-threonylcarbamoyltransferase complex ATPase subunit type 1 TsaE [Frigidibacter sp. RF13]MCY1126630.1 tRNA (adenosine(37)-N6)-threonylcarbamoyltransferase complex ATPase subunit type 1 TsaE [Frigidibacter sp. RF13]
MSAPPEFHLSLALPSPEATAALAARIAPLLGPGQVMLLEGEIGAGKTHFARALIQTLLAAEGRREDVPSPTFTLVQVYETARGEIWHADLYRLTDPSEVIELGLTEAFETAICLVEWPDRLGDLAPREALLLSLRPDATGEGRMATFQATGICWAPVFAALGAAA